MITICVGLVFTAIAVAILAAKFECEEAEFIRGLKWGVILCLLIIAGISCIGVTIAHYLFFVG